MMLCIQGVDLPPDLPVDLPNMSSQTFISGHHRGPFSSCKTNEIKIGCCYLVLNSPQHKVAHRKFHFLFLGHAVDSFKAGLKNHIVHVGGDHDTCSISDKGGP